MADIEKQGRRRRRRVEEEVEEVEEALEEDVDDVRGVTAAKGRATPGRRNATQEVAVVTNPILRPFVGLQEYFRGVQSELEKVTWPTREETIRLSRIVLSVTVAASLVLGLIAFGFTFLFQVGLQQPVIFFVFFAVVAVAIFGYSRYTNARAKVDSSANYNSRLF
jgi:preprotein translocase subunit SecE